MENQFFALRSHKTDEPCVAISMAKKVLDGDRIALVAYGYEGGGCWSDYCALYQLDEYMENVLDVIESHIGYPEESSYVGVFGELMQYTNKFCDFDEEGIPVFKQECLSSPNYNKETDEYIENWNWDDGVHLVASDEWQFHAGWDD